MYQVVEAPEREQVLASPRRPPALRDLYPQLTDAERSEREEFVVEACYQMRDRFNQKELWEKLGLPKLEPESPWYGFMTVIQNRSYVCPYGNPLFLNVLR